MYCVNFRKINVCTCLLEFCLYFSDLYKKMSENFELTLSTLHNELKEVRENQEVVLKTLRDVVSSKKKLPQDLSVSTTNSPSTKIPLDILSTVCIHNEDLGILCPKKVNFEEISTFNSFELRCSINVMNWYL